MQKAELQNTFESTLIILDYFQSPLPYDLDR